ncbi:outer membrane beta-barrel protein [Crocinitomicaceae bacterium]|nr:outer membrane beta-barrel protein [Crocinitomicaceae bacterium]MDB3907613.1 outer membrane beta-barrel protein [Crocinitomicaceae bacterium]
MKTIICILSIFISVSSISQIVPKSRFIGGSVSMYYAKRSTLNLDEFNTRISPQFGKFLSEKWSIQSGFNYQYRSFEIKNEFDGSIAVKNRTNVFGINIGASRYIPITDKFYFTLNAFASGNFALTENIEPETSNRSNIPVNIGVGPGVTYFPHPRWMVQANFGALQFQTNFNDLGEPDIFVGFQFSTFTSGISVSYILRPRMKRVKE